MKSSIKQFIKSQSFTTFDIAIAAIIVAVWIISARFLTLNFGFMKIGVTYSIAILVGLVFKPLQGILISVISDFLSLIVTAGIAFWTVEYAIICPGIVLLTVLLKRALFTTKEKTFIISSLIIQSVTLTVSIAFSIVYNSFMRASSSSDNFLDFTSLSAKIMIWIVLSLQLIYISVLYYLYFTKRSKEVRNKIALVSIVSMIIILFIWIWGPIANIRYLIFHLGKNKSLWKTYDLYLIPRILKTPISLMLYVSIITPMWKAINIVKKSQNKW